MIDFASDAYIFLSTEEFARTALVHGKEVPVLFDLESDDQEQLLITTIHAKTADVEPLSKGLVLTVDGVDYGVLDWYDLDGITVMSCNKEQF